MSRGKKSNKIIDGSGFVVESRMELIDERTTGTNTRRARRSDSIEVGGVLESKAGVGPESDELRLPESVGIEGGLADAVTRGDVSKIRTILSKDLPQYALREKSASGKYPLDIALEKDDDNKTLKELTKNLDGAMLFDFMNARHQAGQDYLHDFAKAGNIEEASIICNRLGSGYKQRLLDKKDPYANTALHYAVERGEIGMVDVLVGDLDPATQKNYFNKVNNDNRTAFGMASVEFSRELKSKYSEAIQDITATRHRSVVGWAKSLGRAAKNRLSDRTSGGSGGYGVGRS